MSWISSADRWRLVKATIAALTSVDPREIRGFLIGRGEPAGAFSLQIDEVRLR